MAFPPSPLPPGVRFWLIAPRSPHCRRTHRCRYVVEVDGIAVALGDVTGKLLMHLLVQPGRRWSTWDLAHALYEDDEDGGPPGANLCILVLLTKLRHKLRRSGIALDMADRPAGHRLVGLRSLPGAFPQPPPRVPPPAPRKPRIVLAETRRAEPVRDSGRYLGAGKSPAPSAPWAFPERVESRNAVGRAHARRGRYPTDDAVPS